MKSAANRWPDLDREALARYVQEIAAWNDQIGLISKRQTASVLERLIVTGADMWRFLSAGTDVARARVVDVGTGGGFPGLLWKLGAPGIDLTLVERRARKATFLMRTVAVLGLSGVRVEARDAAQLADIELFTEAFDVGVTLAVAPPPETAPLVAPLLRPDGRYCTVVPEDAEAPHRAGGMTLIDTGSAHPGTFCLYQKAS